MRRRRGVGRSDPAPFGPITADEARRRSVVYGPLTVGQFDDLERLGFCGTVSLADFEDDRRKPGSIVRAMSRYQVEGWVVPGDYVETWRLTERGAFVLECAFHHMEMMVLEEDGWDGF